MTGNNYISGINESQILKAIDTVTNNIERLEKRFAEIEDIMEKTKASYKAASAETFNSQYNNFKQNYGVVKANLLSYIEDLNRLVRNYRKIDSFASDLFKVNKDN